MGLMKIHHHKVHACPRRSGSVARTESQGREYHEENLKANRDKGKFRYVFCLDNLYRSVLTGRNSLSAVLVHAPQTGAMRC